MQKITILITIWLFASTLSLGQKIEPLLLPIPEDWKYERIDLPMDFAPEMTYEGFEELRFGPGMFDLTSSTYFTYLFAVSFENTTKVKKSALEDFILQYYRGLCAAVAGSKEPSIDYNEINVRLKKTKKGKGRAAHYTAQLTFFDAFTNGQKITLNMDLELTVDKTMKKTYLLALVSPQAKEHDIWKLMYETKEKLYEKAIF
jgi:hypothetical protein